MVAGGALARERNRLVDGILDLRDGLQGKVLLLHLVDDGRRDEPPRVDVRRARDEASHLLFRVLHGSPLVHRVLLLLGESREVHAGHVPARELLHELRELLPLLLDEKLEELESYLNLRRHLLHCLSLLGPCPVGVMNWIYSTNILYICQL